MLRLLVLTAVLLLAPAAALAAPSGAPTSGASFNVLVGRLADYSAAHQASMTIASDLVVLTIDGMEKAQALSEEGAGAARVTSVMDAQEALIRAKIGALQASRVALPPFPTDAFNRLALLAPQFKGKAGAYTQVSVAAVKAIDAAIQFAERSLEPSRKAAGGDEEAMADLAVELVTGVKLMLLSENAMLDVAIAAGVPEHPQTALAESIRASNTGIAAIFDYQVATMSGERVDPAVAASAVRTSAAEARAAALRMAPLAKAMAATLKRGGPYSETEVRLLKILDSYAASSAVEIGLVEVLEKVAALIAGGTNTPEALDAAVAPVDARIQRRMQLQADRIALLKP